MRIDIRRRKPVIANRYGGYSGSGIFPLALRMVNQVARATSLPIIGCGGVSSAEDVIEMMMAGATAVEIGAANLTNPMVAKEIVDRLPQLMDELKIGFNWGNTFDAPWGETTWGNPFTTKEMIEEIKALGFGTIRIPVSWGKHTSGTPDYIIDEEWMERVQTVVDYALDCGLYVFINSHHDNDIYSPTVDNQENAKNYLEAIWKQIAKNFNYADHHLIFQTMNEPRVVGTSYEWQISEFQPDSMKAVEIINGLNQVVLDAIRSTGGNNADRFVLISSYAANPNSTLTDKFKLPEDSVKDRLLLSVHSYTPYNLCLNADSADTTFDFWEQTEIDNFLKGVYQKYSKEGIPVIVDEMGIIHKNNPEERYKWAKYFVSTAKNYGMVCCWWDNGSISSGEKFALFNRNELKVYPESQRVYEGLMDGLKKE
jgi:endoglucanase